MKATYNNTKSKIEIFKIGEYKQKNKYNFPMKGSFSVATDGHRRVSHRWSNSLANEFAEDYHILDKQLKPYSNNQLDLNDYYCFGEKIYSPADGIIIDSTDGLPDNVDLYNDKKANEKINKFSEKLPLLQLMFGNYIIIDHGKKEYSLLAHLKNGSVEIKKNDRVKKGQLIAKCGNSGGSGAPHLHYHLSNNPNVAKGIGLPIKFSNVEESMFKGKLYDETKDSIGHKALYNNNGVTLIKTK